MGKNELTRSTVHIAVVYWNSRHQAVAAANALFAAQAALTPEQRAAMPNYQKPGPPTSMVTTSIGRRGQALTGIAVQIAAAA